MTCSSLANSTTILLLRREGGMWIETWAIGKFTREMKSLAVHRLIKL